MLLEKSASCIEQWQTNTDEVISVIHIEVFCMDFTIKMFFFSPFPSLLAHSKLSALKFSRPSPSTSLSNSLKPYPCMW